MRIGVTQKGDFHNITNWLKKTSGPPPTSAMRNMGRKGVAALQAATPKRTGETAFGWDYRVESNANSATLSFVNNAHMESPISIVRLIVLGHATGTGGYVPPNDFITPALREIMGTAGDVLGREMIR